MTLQASEKNVWMANYVAAVLQLLSHDFDIVTSCDGYIQLHKQCTCLSSGDRLDGKCGR